MSHNSQENGQKYFDCSMCILWWCAFIFLVMIAFGPWFRDEEHAANLSEIKLALFSYLFGYFLPVIGIIYPYIQQIELSNKQSSKSLGIKCLTFIISWSLVSILWIIYSVFIMKYPVAKPDDIVAWTKNVPLASMPFPDCITYYCTVSIGILSGFGIVIQKTK